MDSLYTVGHVSEETGVSIKTLHHYQKKGILHPSKIGDNGYRYYSERDIKRLQEILLYRTMGFSLESTKDMLNATEHLTRIETLTHQKALLNQTLLETQIMIETINQSILIEKKELAMEKKEMFKGLKKEDDSIYRTMQNLTIIFSKPFTLVFFILGIALVIAHSYALVTNNLIFGTDTAGVILALFFIILGVFTSLISGYNLFFVKTKDLLNIVNHVKEK